MVTETLGLFGVGWSRGDYVCICSSSHLLVRTFRIVVYNSPSLSVEFRPNTLLQPGYISRFCSTETGAGGMKHWSLYLQSLKIERNDDPSILTCPSVTSSRR